MVTRKTTKEIADRIDPVYFRTWHRLRKLRFLLSVGLCAVASLWVLAAALLGKATLYSSGPVSASHALFEADCAACHTERFGAIQDAACLACHSPGRHADHDPRCAHCHAEHNGAHADLSAVEDAFCNQCHADHKEIVDFEEHTDFLPRGQEQYLRFGHAVHLGPTLTDATGGELVCADCHQSAGSGFLPIRFADHCAGCHDKRLDTKDNDIVPHGLQPGELRDWIAAVHVRDMDLVKASPDLVGKGAEPPAWRDAWLGRSKAVADALLMPGTGCMLCHMNGGPGQDGRDGIKPPKIPRRWMTRARFDHHAHRSQSCAACHDMRENRSAGDVSLPGILNCRECHHSGGAGDSCVTCHDFHGR